MSQQGENGPTSPEEIAAYFLEESKEEEETGLSVLDGYGETALGEEEVAAIRSLTGRLRRALAGVYVVQMEIAMGEERGGVPAGISKEELRKFQMVYD